ncbi:MAG: NPCBM/NEW2 domain-containing protein [Oscillospiraceae bacterium]|nr:NPCBM/NEW2 domain-containing protein [Oscillospiraceae bacterium]
MNDTQDRPDARPLDEDSVSVLASAFVGDMPADNKEPFGTSTAAMTPEEIERLAEQVRRQFPNVFGANTSPAPAQAAAPAQSAQPSAAPSAPPAAPQQQTSAPARAQEATRRAAAAPLSDAAPRAGVQPYASDVSGVVPTRQRTATPAPAGSAQPFIRETTPPIPDSARGSASEADYVRSDSEYTLPPYIPERAVKRTAQSKRKAKKSSRGGKRRAARTEAPKTVRPAPRSAQPTKRTARGEKSGRRLPVVILCAVLGVLVAAALVFLPSIRFAASLLSGDYAKASTIYMQSVGASRLQSPVGEKIALLTADRALSRYLNGSADYDSACAQLDGIAQISSFTAAANAVKTQLTQQHESKLAYDAAQTALAEEDYATAVEQLQKISPNYSKYDEAARQLDDTVQLYKQDVLAAIASYTSDADFEPLFAVADRALTLLDSDADIRAAYDNAETAFYNYAFNLIRQSALSGDYAVAARVLKNAYAACPNGARIAQLYATYSPYLLATDLLDLPASDQTALSETTSVLTNYVPGSDADASGKSDYEAGLVLRAPVSDSFSRTYAINSQYSMLTGCISAIGASAGLEDTGCYARVTITGDGYTLYSSSSVYGTTSPVSIEADVSNVDTVTIRLELRTHDNTEYAAGLLDFLLFPDTQGLLDLLEAAA